MIEVCSDGHDEIVHGERKCPLCEALKRASELDDEIIDLKNEVKRLENELGKAI